MSKKAAADEAVSKTPAKRPGKTGPRFTPKEVKEILHVYARDGLSIPATAKRFGKSVRGIRDLLVREGVLAPPMTRKERKESPPEPVLPEAARKAAVEAAARKEAVERQALDLERIRQVKDDHFKLNQLVPKVMGKLLAQTLQDGRAPGALEKDMRALKQMAETLKITREEIYVLLQVEKHQANEEQEGLPILEVRELTVEEIKEMVNANRVTDGEDPIESLSEEALAALEAAAKAVNEPVADDDIVVEGEEGDESDEKGAA